MPIENRELAAGTRLVARYKKQDRTCEVVTMDGGLRYRLDDETMHKSPSAAGKAVVGHACNGWVFWSLAGAEVAEPKAKAEKPVKAKKEPAAKKGPKVGKPKKGKSRAKAAHPRGQTTEGDGGFGCGRCDATFPSLEDAQAHVASVHAEP